MTTHAHERDNCRWLLDALSDYIDGELDARLCQEIEAHLAGCENCRVVVDTLRKTVLLYRTPDPPALPGDVEERLFKVLDLEPYLLRGVAAAPMLLSPDPVGLLRGALEIESPSGQEQALAAYLVDAMRQRGYDRAFVDEAGNAIGEIGPADAAHTIVLLGHMDTVPGYIPVRIEGDQLYGRGSVDAKGPLCAFIEAAARVRPSPNWRIVVVGAVEEEAATSKGARHVIPRYQPHACVIGEPSAWDRITLGYKGRLLADFTARQPMGHTAGPLESVAEAAVAWWLGVRQFAEGFNQGRDAAFDRLLPSLRDICSSSDSLHDRVDATVGLRLPLSVERAALEQAIRQAIPGVPDLEVTLSFRGYEPAHRASKNTALVRAFLAAIREQGGRPGFKVKTGTSDMNVVGPAWQCPILAYGPGDSSLDHTPEEHVGISEYLRAIEVLADALNLMLL
jgi:LysW-gamma-L-lysine carboxypeptidase